MKTVIVVAILIGLFVVMGVLMAAGPQGLTGAVVSDIACYDIDDCDAESAF